MQKHPYFDLQIMENDEISNLLGIQVGSRETLQQWPLSCVEKVTTADNKKWIIKSNHQPCNIEGYFYDQATHPNIINPLHIHHDGPYQTIIYAFVEATSYPMENLNSKQKTVDAFWNTFHPIIKEISKPGLPHYLKIDTQEECQSNFEAMMTDLRQLKDTNQLNLVSSKQLGILAEVLQSSLVYDVALTDTGYLHGDFKVDNILWDQQANKLLLLDWARPMIGSARIDEYSFVRSRNFKPDPPTTLIGSLVQIYWLVDCSIQWFPAGINTYDKQMSNLINELKEAYQTINTNQIKM